MIKNSYDEHKNYYEFKQMSRADKTLAQWEDKFKKELEEDEKDETANTED